MLQRYSNDNYGCDREDRGVVRVNTFSYYRGNVHGHVWDRHCCGDI